ncbi:MAG: bifunctional folylpolyglutamate synthase/dihydrofolate synthase [Nannocystales bacterium]
MTYEALFARRTLGVRPGLVAVRGVFETLGSPGGSIPAIHVVGTNGKGSIAAMAEHALRQRGHRTGLFTSPHLQRVTERVRVDGLEVDDTVLEAAIGSVLSVEGDPSERGRPLSFFELLTIAALIVFEQSGVDVLIVEAGLGGRLDSTRVIDAQAVAVGRIDLDHQAYLGDTLVEIAAEKAGVFRDRVPVYSVPQHDPVWTVLERASWDAPCPLRLPEPIAAPLPGEHQRYNAGVALAAAQHLDRSVTPEDIDGTAWPARMERRAVGNGEWILDVAHNPASMEALATVLRGLPLAKTLVIVSCSADKDAAAMATALGGVGECWTITDDELGLCPLPGARMFESLAHPGLEASLHEHVEEGGRVVICGSHRLVGAVMGRWLADGGPPDPSDPR